MDPTTQAHIDPSTLSTSTTPGGTPALTTKPTTTSTTTQHDAQPAVTGLRQRVNKLSESVDSATEHPAVQDAKKAANQQIHQLREFLGRSPAVLRLEKQTGVDRVLLVVGGIFLYLLIIPLNFLHLAQPATNLLTFIPPMLLSARVLERPDENKTKLLLSYYVVFGFVQFAESLMAGFLARRIPQYYTVKLIFLAYLIHPRTKGALKFHEAVLRPAFAMAPSSSGSRGAMTTPPTTKGADSHTSSPTTGGYNVAGQAKTPSATAFSPSTTSGATTSASGFANATSGLDSLNHAPSSATTASSFTAPGEFGHPTTGAEKSAGLGETTVPAQEGSVVPPTLGGSGAGITLPSGGGSGVGLEIPRETAHPNTNVPY